MYCRAWPDDADTHTVLCYPYDSERSLALLSEGSTVSKVCSSLWSLHLKYGPGHARGHCLSLPLLRCILLLSLCTLVNHQALRVKVTLATESPTPHTPQPQTKQDSGPSSAKRGQLTLRSKSSTKLLNLFYVNDSNAPAATSSIALLLKHTWLPRFHVPQENHTQHTSSSSIVERCEIT